MTPFSAVIAAGGAGARLGGGTPKQYRELAGRPMLAWSLETFAQHPDCAEIILVRDRAYDAILHPLLEGLSPPTRLAEGGETRTASVRAGLAQASARAVLIHDAARPWLDAALIDRLLKALNDAQGAAPVLPVPDALARAHGTQLEPVDRDGLVRIQTPQAFQTEALCAAFRAAGPEAVFPDEVALARAQGLKVIGVPGDERTFKVTWPADIARAEALLAPAASAPIGAPVIGSGYDVHRLGPGEGVWLCGVLIPCPFELIGHSDADVGLHAATDAVLGAAALGDIGMHFPPSDPQWKGAASDQFLRHALALAAQSGVTASHLDVTVIAERPKIGPHREAMRARLSAITGLPAGQVSVKATTTEGLGFTGRGEGIAAQAVFTGVRHE